MAEKANDIRNILAELGRFATRRFEELNVDGRYSLRYLLITLVEAVVALCSHIALEGYGYRPTSYRDCVAYVVEREGLGCVRDLKRLLGLRNLLVHRYWEIDDHRIHSSLTGDLRCVEEFLGRLVERYG